MDWLSDNWGSLASVLGVIVSIVGFALAVRQIYKTKTAAESARTAADNARAALSRSITIGDIDRAAERLERIKSELNQGRIDIAREHLLDIMKMLSDIVGRAQEFDESELGRLRRASYSIAELATKEVGNDFTEVIGDLTDAQRDLLDLRVLIEQKGNDDD